MVDTLGRWLNDYIAMLLLLQKVFGLCSIEVMDVRMFDNPSHLIGLCILLSGLHFQITLILLGVPVIILLYITEKAVTLIWV